VSSNIKTIIKKDGLKYSLKKKPPYLLRRLLMYPRRDLNPHDQMVTRF
jgi:hypothetical protein